MAVTAVGFDGTVTEAQWSELCVRMAEIAYRHGVWSGGTVTAGPGRAVTVGTVDAYAAGVWFVNDAPVTVQVGANGSGSTRFDYVVAEVNWMSNTVTFRALPGTASALPALIQNAGSLWQMPLASFSVAAGASSILASDVTPRKPIPREVQSYSGNMSGITLTSTGSAGSAIGPVLSIADPGWSYRLDITCSLYARPATNSQRMRIEVLAGSTVVAYGISSPLGLHQQVFAGAKPSRVFAGRQTLSLRFYSHDANGNVTVGASAANVFDVHVVPA